MDLKQNLITKDKYSVKCPYIMNPIGICVHNTANNASAKNEIAYMKRNNEKVSYHIAVDDVEAIQAIPFNRNAFHAGDGSGNGNRKHIGIEICYSTGSIDKFKKAEVNTAKVIAKLLKQYGWGIDKVKKHQDFSGKYCPHKTLDLGWNRFLNLIKAELNNNDTTTNNSELYRIRKSWNDINSQIGAYKDLSNAKKECKKGYSVFNSKGISVYSNNNDNNSNSEVYRVRKSWNNVDSQIGAYKDLSNAKKACKAGYSVYNNKGISVYSNSNVIKINSKVVINKSAKKYATGQLIPSFVKGNTYTVYEINGDKILLKEIMSWVLKKDLTLK